MFVKEINEDLVIRLEVGEDIVESLLKVGREYDIEFAEITGIGASNLIEVGSYNVSLKKYKSVIFRGELEITSIMGNLSKQEDEPYLHLHITFADENLDLHGGHLNKAIISATCEIVVRRLDGKVGRIYQDEVGLNVFDI
ncbi:MAG: DNA-binding protein [Tissierellia bacterium]|nr:DNA-binding protein [Tissierellia bacterium]